MAFINPIIYLSNRNGIPRIKSTAVTVNGTTNVQYSFNSDVRFSSNFSGLVLIKLEQEIPSGTTSTLPVVFISDNGELAPVEYGGTAITVASLAGTGIYLAYYERSNNTLQILTGV